MKFYYSSLLAIFILSKSCCCYAVTTINYPELFSAYAFHLNGFQLNEQKDPFFDRSVQDLKDVCDEVARSTSFVLLEADTLVPAFKTTVTSQSSEGTTSELIEYQPLRTKLRQTWSHLFPFKSTSASTTSSFQEGSELRELPMETLSEYQTLDVKLRKSDATTRRVNLFPCPNKGIDTDEGFISYGFDDDFAYFFTRREEEPILFAGLVERSPDLNLPIMASERMLEKHFINALHHGGRMKPLPLAEDPVCKLNRNQRFRLCSLAHETLSRSDIVGDKFVFNKVDACIAQKTLFLREMHENPDKYLTKDVRVNALPCFMLNDDGTKGTLYLTHDPLEPDSVFSFILGRDYILSKAILYKFHAMKAHIRNITVLKHATYFY